MQKLSARAFGGPRRPVDRALREGDEVAGFTVLDVPGHSPGHLAYWRESDRVVVLGDVFFGINPLTGLRHAARAARLLHARPGAQPRVGAQDRGARAGGRLLRPRAAAARHEALTHFVAGL